MCVTSIFREILPSIGHILRRNCLLKQVIEGKIKGEMDVTRRGRRRKKLLDDLKDRTGEDTLIWKRRLWIALCGGIVLEEALDLSSDSILNNNNYLALYAKVPTMKCLSFDQKWNKLWARTSIASKQMAPLMLNNLTSQDKVLSNAAINHSNKRLATL